MRIISLYTDGACSGNPGRGGWAAIAFDEEGNPIIKKGEGYRKTTNNRMEIMAVAEGLFELQALLGSKAVQGYRVMVYSDSEIVVNTMNNGWSKNKNIDLWRKLEQSIKSFGKVEFNKVKGHSTNTFNNMADRLAVYHSQPENSKNIDFYYEELTLEVPKIAMQAKDTHVTEVRLKGFDSEGKRSVEVLLSNGSTVTITALYEGFQQIHCTKDEASLTVDIAERFNGWLHGKSL